MARTYFHDPPHIPSRPNGMTSTLCPICGSLEPHDWSKCRNDPETIADFLADLNWEYERDFRALSPEDQAAVFERPLEE